MSKIDIYDWLLSVKFVRPRWVVVGIFSGFIACCIAGRMISHTNIFHDFHRFHNFINPRSAFYPTVSEMICIAEDVLKPEQTIVVVGGNSVFYGWGQNTSELWSDDLQRQLGDHFKVVNFALPASEPFEGAYCVAESLMKRGRKVVYVTNAGVGLTDYPEGSPQFGYSYWDAREKRLLEHDKDRDALVQLRVDNHGLKKRENLNDLRMRMQLDSLLYFEDLWTAVAYLKVFTVWTESTAAHPFLARKDYVGEPYIVLPSEQVFGNDTTAAAASSFDECFLPGTATPEKMFWMRMTADASRLIPATNKKNCVVAVLPRSPRFLSMLSTRDRERHRVALEESKKVWKSAGYSVTDVTGQLTDDDFWDTLHLKASGGRKIAASLSRKVRELNSNLGFEKKSVL